MPPAAQSDIASRGDVPVRIGVLGPTTITLGDDVVQPGSPKQRALLAALALHANRPVSADVLVDAVWPDHPPPGASGTLQTYVAGLRRVLEPDRAARGSSSVLVTASPGYCLRLADDGLDAARFERAVAEARGALRPLAESLAPTADELPRPAVAGAVDQLAAAIQMWRGEPYGDLDGLADAVPERARLTELLLHAEELHAAGSLALGEHAAAAARLEQLTGRHPLRERFWVLRAVALTRSGRQADALDALRRLRTVLADELGLDPSQQVRELETAVLQQDPRLQWTASASAADPVRRPRSPRTPSADWPLVGRDQELARLVGLLDEAEAGRPRFAALVGDPGIGKTRLAEELAGLARERGAHVGVAACSQDDGAPPLWPWTPIALALGLEPPTQRRQHAGADGSQFELWDELSREISDRASVDPVVLVFDDLQWSDLSSLRALRHLIGSVRDARLLVVCTWRRHPSPSGALAELAEVLARQHALRLDLPGLGEEQTAALVETVTTTALTPAAARILRERTDGNPFFVVEYARLLATGGDGPADLAPPAAAVDVVARRLELLPEPTGAPSGRRQCSGASSS